MPSDPQPGSLLRRIGPVAAVAIVVNAVLGTGIFLKAPSVLCAAGGPARAMAAWVLAGLISLAGALVYAELAAMMPRAGGEYVFLREAFGPVWGFLYGWMRYFVGNAGGQAALLLAFVTFLRPLAGEAIDEVYFAVEVFGYELAFGTEDVVVLAVLGLATLVNCASVAASGRLATAFAVVKVGLVVALGAAALLLAPGDWGHFAAPLSVECGGTWQGGAVGFGAALLGALWAYNGWYSLTLLGGEVREPGRTFPLGLGLGVVIVVAVSLLANVAYLYALAPDEIAALGTKAPVAVEVARRALGPTGAAVALAGALVSAFGALQVALLGNARVGYAMAVDGLFFESSARLSPRSRVPIRSLLAQAQWTAILALSASIDALTDSMIFASLIFYCLGAAALVALRRREPERERPYRVWGYPAVPLAFLAAGAAVLVATVVTSPLRSLGGLGLIALGLPAYWYWSREDRGR